jgi:glycosyltransferase involved in cell wall biosynthesis
VTPRVSVVVATHDRPEGIARTLAALRAQTLPAAEFEVVVVDDGSGPETAHALAAASTEAGPALRLLRNATAGGPAVARNRGWREAAAPLIAFTDDDCEPVPGWLEAGLAAWAEEPRRFVQGPVRPNPQHADRGGPFSHTLTVEALGPWWETANVFYPRAALEHAGGFDEDHYSGPGGEDTDLGWTLIAAGWEPAWAPGALVHHDVTAIGPARKLRMAWRWDETMLVFRRHPELRRELTAKVFWSPNHWWLLRAAVALALPSRLWWLRWWLAAPYVLRLGTLRPDVVAFLVVHDLVETAACARGGLRYRVPVL